MRQERVMAMIFGQTTFALCSVETNLKKIAFALLKISYCMAGVYIFWLHFTSEQDFLVRQQLAFLRSFLLAFPISLLVDFYAMAPFLLFDYAFDGYFSRTYNSDFIGSCFVIIIVLVNLFFGYRQWFILLPNLIRRIFSK